MLKLYSAWYCPFAQRALMALHHHDLSFELAETDPYQKTAHWLEVSLQSGQVPVLTHEGGSHHSGFRLPGSMRVVEAVDHMATNPGKALYPVDACERAAMQSWIDFADRQVIPQFYRFLKSKPDSREAQEAKSGLEAGLLILTSQMHPDGPLFAGSSLSAFDVALAPFADRASRLLSHYRDYRLPTTGKGWTRYQAWWNAVRSQEAFCASFECEPDYDARLVAFYAPYAEGGGQMDVTAIS